MIFRDYDFKLGADPELFLFSFSGKPVCAHGFVPGTKDAPVKLGKAGNTIQLDGMAAEIGIPPQSDEEGFVNAILGAQKELAELVYRKGLQPVAVTTCDFGEDFAKAPDECKILGCDPDFNAYVNQRDASGEVIEPQLPAVNVVRSVEGVTYRTGGGHVHVGWAPKLVDPFHPDHLLACRYLTVAMDLFLGVPSLLMDDDNQRRSLYGAAGAFRPKPYGMEYRPLSNFWLSDERLIRWVYRATCLAIESCIENYRNPKRRAVADARRFINAKPGEFTYVELLSFVEKTYDAFSHMNTQKKAREALEEFLNV